MRALPSRTSCFFPKHISPTDTHAANLTKLWVLRTNCRQAWAAIPPNFVRALVPKPEFSNMAHATRQALSLVHALRAREPPAHISIRLHRWQIGFTTIMIGHMHATNAAHVPHHKSTITDRPRHRRDQLSRPAPPTTGSALPVGAWPPP